VVAARKAADEGNASLASALDAAIRLAREADDSRLRTQNEAVQREAGLRERALSHRSRIDNVRHTVAILLITSLFAIIAIGAIAGTPSDSIAQLAAPISGLAGIAVGWLFGGRESDHTAAAEASPTTPIIRMDGQNTTNIHNLTT
jgi:hypothetical protein